MTPDQSAAYQALQQSQQARKAGNKRLARQYAEQAARLAPDNEEAWMMMAALASPRASVVYMEKALQINPESERVRQGVHWAVERLRKETPPAAAPAAPAKKANARPIFLYALALVACMGVVLAAWYVTPAAAALINDSLFPGQQNVPAWAPVDVAKPTNTLLPAPTQMATLAPLATASSTEAPTEADTAVATDTPVDTPALTDTPLPTDVLAVTDTPLSSDTPTLTPADAASPTPQLAADLAAAAPTALPTDDPNYASPTPLPTDTPGPLPTAVQAAPITVAVVPAPAAPPGNVKVGAGTHWIDVDLTHQMTYAYEGNTLVNSFLVSTGTWQYPTVTGQYHIYVKYLYTLMHGDGYYLPNVPYTMYFYKSYGIHGTYWHHNFGHPMSHGCVNMYTPDAEWLYYWASVGTLVNIHY